MWEARGDEDFWWCGSYKAAFNETKLVKEKHMNINCPVPASTIVSIAQIKEPLGCFSERCCQRKKQKNDVCQRRPRQCRSIHAKKREETKWYKMDKIKKKRKKANGTI